MPTKTDAAQQAIQAATPVPPVAKTHTQWEAFAKAGLAPIAIECSSYHPPHTTDFSCHTKLKLDTETLKRHIASEHGGVFHLYLRKTEKPSPLWAELALSGLEAHDIRCAACDKQFRFHPTSILPCTRPHRGKTKVAYRESLGDQVGCVIRVLVTLALTPPPADDADETV